MMKHQHILSLSSDDLEKAMAAVPRAGKSGRVILHVVHNRLYIRADSGHLKVQTWIAAAIEGDHQSTISVSVPGRAADGLLRDHASGIITLEVKIEQESAWLLIRTGEFTAMLPVELVEYAPIAPAVVGDDISIESLSSVLTLLTEIAPRKSSLDRSDHLSFFGNVASAGGNGIERATVTENGHNWNFSISSESARQVGPLLNSLRTTDVRDYSSREGFYIGDGQTLFQIEGIRPRKIKPDDLRSFAAPTTFAFGPRLDFAITTILRQEQDADDVKIVIRLAREGERAVLVFEQAISRLPLGPEAIAYTKCEVSPAPDNFAPLSVLRQRLKSVLCSGVNVGIFRADNFILFEEGSGAHTVKTGVVGKAVRAAGN